MKCSVIVDGLVRKERRCRIKYFKSGVCRKHYNIRSKEIKLVAEILIGKKWVPLDQQKPRRFRVGSIDGNGNILEIKFTGELRGVGFSNDVIMGNTIDINLLAIENKLKNVMTLTNTDTSY